MRLLHRKPELGACVDFGISPGQTIEILNADAHGCPSWFVIDLTRFTVGSGKLTLLLRYDRVGQYAFMDIDSQEQGGQIFDIQLPPADGVICRLELRSGLQFSGQARLYLL